MVIQKKGGSRRLTSFEKTFIILIAALFSLVSLGILFDNFSDDVNSSPRRLSGGSSSGSRLGGTNINSIKIIPPSFIVGAPSADVIVPSGFPRNYGKVFAYSNDGTLAWQRHSEHQNGLMGSSVVGIGDINRDGYKDFIVGAPGDGLTHADGRVYALSGKGGSTLWMVEEYDLAVSSEFGGRVSLMEDLNGDGIDEIIVSDILYDRQEANGTIIFDVGKVHILSGKNGARLWSVEGEGTGYWFGYSISRAGDVNGDSIDDVIVGAYNFEYDSNPLTQRRGKIYIYSGLNGALLWTAEGEGAHNKFGYSVSDAGDVDGDGYDDIAVSAPDYDRVELNGSTTEWVGKAYIYSGLLGTVLWSVEGEVEHQRLGDGISNVGDIDFDGFDDIVVGSSRYHYSYPWIYVGRASVYSGQGGDEIFSWEGEDHGSGWLGSDHFGGYVAGVGDINEDGYNDVAVAATGYDLNAVETNAGKVYIYSGQDGALLLSVVGPEKDSGFGVGLSGAEPLW